MATLAAIGGGSSMLEAAGVSWRSTVVEDGDDDGPGSHEARQHAQVSSSNRLGNNESTICLDAMSAVQRRWRTGAGALFTSNRRYGFIHHAPKYSLTEVAMKKTKLLVATIGMGLVAGIAFVPDSRAAKLESWHKKLEKPGVRFDSKFNGHAQLDKETDLTWETRPDPSTMLFWQAQRNCFEKLIDERRGWRVPTVDELMTLSAPSQNGSVGLMPDTLPFQTGAMQNFEVWWTSTEAEAGDKFVVYREGITGAVTAVGSSFSARIICVRGPGTARGAN